MVNHGDADKTIWGTEFGAPTGTSERAVTGEEQAERLREGYEQWRRWGFTGPLFSYTHRDKGTDAGDRRTTSAWSPTTAVPSRHSPPSGP